jgi:hypothetical protein
MASESLTSQQFFVLEVHPNGSRYDVEVESVKPVNIGEGVSCPKCGDPIGMLPWIPPCRANLILHGEEFGDLIDTPGHDFLVSERFAQAFRVEGLTGLEGFHPLELVRLRGRKHGLKPVTLPNYLVVRAQYGSATVDVVRSGIRYTEPPICEACRYAIKKSIHGFCLAPGTWQGQDIFRPFGLTGSVTVSERFRRFVARHNFTNMQITPTEKYTWDPAAHMTSS